MNNLYNEKIEALINAALADGVLTEKEKQVLFKKAQAEGIDLDEFEMVLDARLVELKKKAASAPKSNKYGDVRKCPACGAMVPALATSCPECGYEFSGIEGNLSSKKLGELLIEAGDDYEKKKNIIETFPIPNTKSDLYEFITYLEPKSSSWYYREKYEQCIIKANTLFPNDPLLLPLIESLEEKHLKQEKQKKWERRKDALVWGIMPPLIGIGIIIGIILLIMNKCSGGDDRAKERIEQAMKTGNTDSIMKEINASTDLDSTQVNSLIRQLIDQNKVDAAISLYENNKSSYNNISWTGGDYHRSNISLNLTDACMMIYKALIAEERMDDAWKYKSLKYHKANHSSNYIEYVQYMNDVVVEYCKKGKKKEAHQFVDTHLNWIKAHAGKEKADDIKKQMTELIKKY